MIAMVDPIPYNSTSVTQGLLWGESELQIALSRRRQYMRKRTIEIESIKLKP